MRVVLVTADGANDDIEVRANDPDATVGDLLDALPGPSSTARPADPAGIALEGRFCHAELALAEISLHEGAELRVGLPQASGTHDREAGSTPRIGIELRVVGGLDAGRRLPLGPGPVTVGRDPDSDFVLTDAGVSRRHLTLALSAAGTGATLTDEGSHNGTWLEGRRLTGPAEIAPGQIFEAGDTALTLAPTTPAGGAAAAGRGPAPGAAGTIPFNRPPRTTLRDGEIPIAVPEPPPEPERPRLSLVSAIGPLVLGVVMVIALHNIVFALFMLLSPVLVIGGWLENRRHAKRQSRGQTREHQEQLERFRRQVAGRREQTLAEQRMRLPDLATLCHRAERPEPSLWERRPVHADFLELSAGLAQLPFRPELARRLGSDPLAEQILAANDRLPLAPAPVDLRDRGVVGIVGPRQAALAVARSLLVQAAVLHGPADLQIAVAADPAHAADWEFAKWLPHARDHARGPSARLLAADPAAAETLFRTLGDRSEGDARQVLAVLDSPPLVEGRGAIGRGFLRQTEAACGIVIATSAERLPANCTAVVELAEGTAEGTLRHPQQGEQLDPVLLTGISAETARRTALALARFEDADLELEGGTLPPEVALLDLIALPEPDAETVRDRWRRHATRGEMTATFALAQDGPLTIDLVRDGPHGLVAGTTGAGKSELLRSLVAALAAAHDPERLNFVLIDYKGGSAFARCAELPHTVGLVTDLDEQLGERALESLEAELRHRERTLRDHHADDLIDLGRLVAAGRAEPLPRLLVIIDEFATLATELPDFIASLVGIAQRGRSLGVHLLLATQRPSGAVNENIRANTNLRVCLRVQTGQDSTDVIDSPAASRIGRGQPGRAQVRLGPAELIPIQTALVTGWSPTGARAPVELSPFSFATASEPAHSGASLADANHAPTDLDRLVAAAVAAHDGAPPPRRPWLAPLPAELPLDALLEQSGPLRPFAGTAAVTDIVPLGLIDDPRAQAQQPAGWNLEAGNLLIFGLGGSGTTTALATLALALAARTTPADTHLYVLDFGAGELAPLAGLPHTGAVIGASERERQVRLVRRLRDELAARRGLDVAARAELPRIVVLLDGFAGFTSEHSDAAGDALRDEFARVWADGPELGIHTAIAADRPGAVPVAIASLAQQRLVLALAELADYAQFGLQRRSVPRQAPGRAVLAGTTPLVLQIARPSQPLRDAVQAIASASSGAGLAGPAPVEVLPARIEAAALLERARPLVRTEPWFLPLALGDTRLEPVGLELYPGEHAIVAGPARSGRTNTLRLAAEATATLYPGRAIFAVATRRSGLRDHPGLAGLAGTAAELTELIGRIRALDGPAVLLIDDADVVEDPTRALTELVGDPSVAVHVIAAARADALRALGHWSAGVRAARTGLLLQPDLQMDGGLLGVPLPRRPAPPQRPGCGYLVAAGAVELAQVALASG